MGFDTLMIISTYFMCEVVFAACKFVPFLRYMNTGKTKAEL